MIYKKVYMDRPAKIRKVEVIQKIRDFDPRWVAAPLVVSEPLVGIPSVG